MSKETVVRQGEYVFSEEELERISADQASLEIDYEQIEKEYADRKKQMADDLKARRAELLRLARCKKYGKETRYMECIPEVDLQKGVRLYRLEMDGRIFDTVKLTKIEIHELNQISFADTTEGKGW